MEPRVATYTKEGCIISAGRDSTLWKSADDGGYRQVIGENSKVIQREIAEVAKAVDFKFGFQVW